MRIMNWNIEHMNSWWEGGSANPPVLRETFAGNNFSPAITDVPALAARVGTVIRQVDPDVVAIQEGAGLAETIAFFNEFVDEDAGWQVLRGDGGGQALVVAARLDRDVTLVAAGPNAMGGVNLTEPFNADTNADLVIEPLEFARRPQAINLTAHGRQFLLLNNHLKSKFVNEGETLFNAGGDQRLRFFAESLIARRRISGEAFRIRTFLDQAFQDNPLALVIVTGDLNDGPGADFFEENFLTHSVVDRVFGSIFEPHRQLTHVLFHGDSTDFTAQFFDFIAGETMSLVLDHIGLSPGIEEEFDWQGRVAVAEYESQRVDDASLQERDRLPSDHRPVVVDLTPRLP